MDSRHTDSDSVLRDAKSELYKDSFTLKSTMLDYLTWIKNLDKEPLEANISLTWNMESRWTVELKCKA